METNGETRAIAGLEMKIVLANLTPAQLEKVSGLSTTLQRVWRRRGEIPARTGSQASFSARDAAAISVGVALNRYGISPAEAMDIGKRHAAIALRCALERGGACEVTGPRETVKHFVALFNGDDLSFLAELAGQQDSDLRRLLYSLDGEAPRLEDFVFTEIEELPSVSGYFVNLQAIGHRLLTVVGGPLFRIQLVTKDVNKLDFIKNMV